MTSGLLTCYLFVYPDKKREIDFIKDEFNLWTASVFLQSEAFR
jgi:hypothetical protein